MATDEKIVSCKGLRSGVALAMLHLSQEALIDREDTRAALLALLDALASAGAPKASVDRLRKWAKRETTVKAWEE